MSLEVLPTEVDENIIRRLSKPELDSLSRTSRYYRNLTEPFLYKDLTFSTHHDHKIKRLFLTILERKELAVHI